MISPNRSPSVGAKLLARIGISAAIVTLLVLFWSTNNLFCQIELIRMETERSAAEYMANSDRAWAKMRSVVDDVPPNDGIMHRFGRDAKPKQNELRGSEFHALNQCQKCARLSCNPGLTGPPGAPGEDGVPGMPGKLGAPGVDGVDIHEDLLPDLPCIVCPAGSQGPRGLHGERGLPGPAGIPGRIGVDGRPGPNGPRGISGSVGRKGNDGMPGEAGPPGETVVGGLGVKGPPGKLGPEGLVGLQGLPGRPSNIAGQPGRQGPRGAVGLPGEPGESGPPGPPAPPGDIGLTPNYCPMHCPFRARGQTVFVPRPDDENNNNDNNDNDYVFPPILMMSHDEEIGDGTDGDGDDIYDATGEEDGAKTVQKNETMAGDQKQKEK